MLLIWSLLSYDVLFYNIHSLQLAYLVKDRVIKVTIKPSIVSLHLFIKKVSTHPFYFLLDILKNVGNEVCKYDNKQSENAHDLLYNINKDLSWKELY